ncbi:MAG: NUDIX hydrolase, partial [Candidatus Cloacimonadaceae bacterium]
TELANALAACAVVETMDGTVFAGLRNERLAETSAVWHVPGGTLDQALNPIDFMKQELAEELNIAEQDIRQALCMGLAENLIMQKPEFLCYFHLNLNEQQLAAKLLNAPDKDEHTEFVFVPLEELQDFIEVHSFAPIGKAAVKLYLDYLKSL